LLDADRAIQHSLWLLSFLIPTSFAICMEYYHLSRIGVENDEIARTFHMNLLHSLVSLPVNRFAVYPRDHDIDLKFWVLTISVSPSRPPAMLSHAPSPSPAAFFKPRPSSAGSRLGAKHLTATAAAAASTHRSVSASAASRRGFLLFVPSLAAASAVLRPLPSAATEADDAETPAPHPSPTEEPLSPQPAAEEAAEAETKPEPSESAMSRVYDATVLGEPEALAGDARGRVWEKLAAARVVYLGEAELEPDPDDRVVELEIVRDLAGRCADAGRGLALALEAFPCDLQQQLDQFMDGRCGALLSSPSAVYFIC
jgi:hypothetical protein